MKKIQGKFYVDDLNTGVYSLKDGIELCKKLKIKFQELQFNLRKLPTNSKEFEDIVEDILPKWNNICKYLNSLQEININRCCYVYQFDDPIDSYCLHGFSDSSLAAYATCIYSKSVSRSGNICVTFVTTKKILYHTKIGIIR